LPELRYLHTDALGTPVAKTDLTGAVVERTVYAPYGAPMTPVDGLGYTGHAIDQATGLVYAQQRYYDPVLGRFLAVDPMVTDTANAWNFNRYNYAANSPYKFTDPDGRAIETGWDAFNVGIGIASLGANLAVGNYGGAAVDAGGLIYDGIATAVPGLPGGASAGIKAYRAAGIAREVVVAKKLAAANPAGKVQSQRALRTADGKRAIDPVTGKGRVVDHAVISGGKAETFETTSMTADKTAQLAREQRILDSGGTFIRDKDTRELVPVTGPSKVVRVE
jgi:RHS repeat-associated protein